VPDVIPKAPTSVLKVDYASGGDYSINWFWQNNVFFLLPNLFSSIIVSVNLGNILTPTQVKSPPIVQWDADQNAFYTLCM
jgi:hypothetical protein